MDTVPTSVIECVRHGVAPREQEGMDWCASADCEQCEEAVWSELLRERDRLKAERDRALAELDKALGEREDAMLSERNIGFNAGFDEGFASADDWLAQHEDAMAEHGWVRGPLDADGKMWCSGDMSDSNWGVIEGIAYEDGRWLVSGHDKSAPWVPADSIRHYHAPTVEDVLREMLDAWGELPSNATNDAIVAEYAAKLRLADE